MTKKELLTHCYASRLAAEHNWSANCIETKPIDFGADEPGTKLKKLYGVQSGSLGSLAASLWGEGLDIIVERRLFPRFSLQIPVLLSLPDIGLQIPAQTCNVSAGGVLFCANEIVAEEKEVEFTLKFPQALTSIPLEVECRANVVRCEVQTRGAKVGIAVSLKKFDFLLVGPVWQNQSIAS